MEVDTVRRVQGGGLVVVGVFLLVVGVILRWDLIDWLIDAAGMVLIILGAIIGVIGLVQMFTGGGRKDYEDF